MEAGANASPSEHAHPPMQLDRLLGALLVGTWANTILFTIEIVMAVRYLGSYRDGWSIKGPLLFAVTVDLVGTVSDCAGVYLYTITHWGDEAFLTAELWTTPSHLLTTGFAAITTQIFLVVGVNRLMRDNRLRPFVVSFLALLSLTSFAGSMWLSITEIAFPKFADRATAIKPATVWLAMSGVADICIAATLFLEIWKVWTKDGRRENRTDSPLHGTIRRLLLTTVETGATSASVATLSLIAFLVDRQDNISVAIAYLLGRTYTITMLVCLNGRETSTTSTSGSSAGSRSAKARSGLPSHTGITVNRVEVASHAGTSNCVAIPLEALGHRGMQGSLPSHQSEYPKALYHVGVENLEQEKYPRVDPDF